MIEDEKIIELMKRQICLIALVSIHLLIVAVRVKI